GIGSSANGHAPSYGSGTGRRPDFAFRTLARGQYWSQAHHGARSAKMAKLVLSASSRTVRSKSEGCMTAWKIEGDYMETCNCNLLCPCLSSNMAAQPPEKDCKAALAMKINKGEKDGIRLDGISFIVLLHSPGPMIEGNIKVGLIIDERANDAQAEAIKAIASGAAGGPMANLAPLVSELAGIERRPIDFSWKGMNFPCP